MGEKLIRASDARRAILNIDPKCAYCIDSIPAVDAVEVVHGRWIDTIPTYDNGYCNNAHKCSNCGDYYTTDPSDLYYCPRCGAKMEKFNRPNCSPTFEQRMQWMKEGALNG